MSLPRRPLFLAGAAVAATVATSAFAGVASTAPIPDPVTFAELGRYDTNAATGGETAAEIVAYEDSTLYVLSIGKVDLVDISDPTTPTKVGEILLPADPTSVAVSRGLVAVSVPADPTTDPGSVMFFRGTTFVGAVTVGALPDMVAFTPDGSLLAVANEGEPNSYGQPDSVDPEGTVSVITTQPFRTPAALRKPIPASPVTTIDFRAFNVGGSRHAELPPGVRITGPGATVAQDLEPEYITISEDNRTAWVSLQENNALALVDLRAKRVLRLIDLGSSDHSAEGFGIDASDQDGAVNIQTWPVKGLYMPDGIASYRVGGRDYVLTANEGDAREYTGYADVARARSVADFSVFPEANIQAQLGRLNVITSSEVPRNAAGRLTELYSLGSRSFSIRTAEGDLVWDSGDDFEQITALALPANFNASNSNNTFDNRSDDKGPEPEAVVVGTIDGRHYAFVALERIGGLMIYDVSDPAAPVFVQYLTTRVFAGDVVGPDSGAEGLLFIGAGESPTGQPLVVVGNEVTGTVNVFGAGPSS